MKLKNIYLITAGKHPGSEMLAIFLCLWFSIKFSVKLLWENVNHALKKMVNVDRNIITLFPSFRKGYIFFPYLVDPTLY